MSTIRETRYEQLRRAGFLRSESMCFSHFDFRKVPYIMQLYAQRQKAYQQFNLNNRTMQPKERLAKWDQRIQRLAQQNGWTKEWRDPKTGKLKKVVDPWAELRAREDDYKPKHRQYESPHQKRWRDFQAFDRRLQKSMQYS